MSPHVPRNDTIKSDDGPSNEVTDLTAVAKPNEVAQPNALDAFVGNLNRWTTVRFTAPHDRARAQGQRVGDLPARFAGHGQVRDLRLAT